MARFDHQLLHDRLVHYAGPIEFHVTVRLDNTVANMNRFRDACRAQNGKSIWIELDAGNTTNQPMYGTRLFSDPSEQAERIREVVDRLAEDFAVTRIKVEAGPNNKNIPQSETAAGIEPTDCYFEHHVALRFKTATDFRQLTEQFASYNGHLSRNAFKAESETGEQIRFVTQRFHDVGQVTAENRLNRLLEFVGLEGYDVVDCEREYNIFDSNLHLDYGWMS